MLAAHERVRIFSDLSYVIQENVVASAKHLATIIRYAFQQAGAEAFQERCICVASLGI
jgi:Flp pilus assembly CpaF family ATPase